MTTETTNQNPSGSKDPLPASTVFELLLDQRRRYFLYALSRTDGAKPLEELIEELEYQVADPDRYERIRADLHHNHLPKLVDAAVVSYDREAGTVEPLPAMSHLENYLELAKRDDRWYATWSPRR